MFVDKITIRIKAGNGGDGCMSFYTPKYMPTGGPDGGDGGRGGDIIFVTDPSKNTLIEFRFARKFRADNGNRGDNNNKTGKSGSDLIIRVPQGTVIKDAESGNVIADMFDADARKVILRGGRGGKGNSRFVSSRRHAPRFFQSGEKTVERTVTLELKTIADVGLVGFPNVGKSSLLAALTGARPKIADYHFTTLSPNLGVVKMFDTDFTIADIPGLIEGAADGTGLGHEFLRHVERTRLLVHVVDISGIEGREPVSDYKTVQKELAAYSERLADAPEIIALNKCDLLQDKSNITKFCKAVGKPVVAVSAAAHDGLDALLKEIYARLKELPPPARIAESEFEYDVRDTGLSFEINRLESNVYELTGGLVNFLERSISLDDPHSFAYFQKTLSDKGVLKALRAAGVKEGDTVIVGDVEFDYIP